MPDELTLDEQMVRDFGFAPETVSPTAYRFGVIAKGPRAGFLCVYTKDLAVDRHATAKRNFVDADRGYNPYNEEPGWMVYIFAPLRRG